MAEEIEKELTDPVEADELPPEQSAPEAESTAESAAPVVDDSERIRLENEAYKKHFDALNAEIAEIRQKYQTTDPADESDPVAKLSGEVGELKSGFAELKELLQRNANTNGGSQNQQMQPQIPLQPYYPQIPAMPPMFQSSMIMPAPQLPYIQTPVYAPANITPNFGQNSNLNNGGMNNA